MDLAYFAKVLAALFAIMSPVANLPVFMSLTADRDTAGQRKVAVTVILGLLTGLAITVFAGSAILKIFGIGIDAFRLAGGLLILFIALSLLHGQDPPPHAGSTKEKESFHDQNNPGIYPMTIPILLGPGAISSIIIFHEQTKTIAMKIAFGAAIVAMVVILGVTFFAAPFLSRILEQTAITILSRLMGMLLAAIAMQMMVESLKNLLPGLA